MWTLSSLVSLENSEELWLTENNAMGVCPKNGGTGNHYPSLCTAF